MGRRGFVRRMAWKIRANAEFAFVSSGLLVALMGWIADLFATLGKAAGLGGHGTDDLFFRVNITFFAFGLAAIGVGYEQHERFFRDRSWGVRYVAGYLILLDGVLHAFAFNDHLADPFQAAFFGVLAPVQVAVGLALPYLRRSWDAASLALAAFLLAAYIGTRLAAVWPLGGIEEIEALGILSKLVEGLAVICLVQLVRARGGPRPVPVPPDAAVGAR